jgi:hypothetical protein
MLFFRLNELNRRTMGQRTVSSSPLEDTLVVGPTLGLPEVLRHLGADPENTLSEVGLDLALFNEPTNQISYNARDRLLVHCVATTGCRHLGLLVGQRAGLQSLGLVGLFAKYSPDVGTALRNLVQWFHALSRGAVLTLKVEGG